MENSCIRSFVLAMICLYLNAVINATENCDCDIIQIYDPENPNQYHNFTYAYKDENGPVYSSNEKYHLLWNNTEGSWSWDIFNPIKANTNCQGERYGIFEIVWEVENDVGLSYTKMGKWEIIPSDHSGFMKSRCLRQVLLVYHKKVM